MILLGNVYTVKLTIFGVSFDDGVEYQSGISAWPSGGTYAAYPYGSPPSYFIPNLYAKTVAP